MSCFAASDEVKKPEMHRVRCTHRACAREAAVIRVATIAELRAAAALLAAAAAETGHGPAVRWDLLDVLQSAGLLVLHVLEVDGQIVGYACATITPELFGDASPEALVASMFVAQAHRARWAQRLLQSLALEACRRGAAGLRLLTREPRVQQWLEHLGFERIGVALRRSLMQYSACHGLRTRDRGAGGGGGWPGLRRGGRREAGRGVSPQPPGAGGCAAEG
jgi:N-acetylglutamate synthase-like GNAT family acetyltransferase